MAVKRVTSSKRDREKAKQSKREEKQKRKEERLSSGSRSFEEMLAYVDENGILHSTPEGVKPKEEIDASEIEISIPKKAKHDSRISDSRPSDPSQMTAGFLHGFFRGRLPEIP